MILWFFKHTERNNSINEITTPDLDLYVTKGPYRHIYKKEKSEKDLKKDYSSITVVHWRHHSLSEVNTKGEEPGRLIEPSKTKSRITAPCGPLLHGITSEYTATEDNVPHG